MNLDSFIWPESGKYIVAVSGGIDSMVLLHLLSSVSEAKGYKLVVAHFDHAMRSGSSEDTEFVRNAAGNLGISFESGKSDAKLVNEADARVARYAFLKSVAVNNQAGAIITAHHQDDLIETSLLNLARGSKRVGLTPFRSESPLRPFRNTSRSAIKSYATDHDIEWREDPTNADTANPRNFARHILLQNASEAWREDYMANISALESRNNKIDIILESYINAAKTHSGLTFSRGLIEKLSQSECGELFVAAMRKLSPGVELDERLVQELVIFSKTAKTGRMRPIRKGIEIQIKRLYIKIGNN